MATVVVFALSLFLAIAFIFVKAIELKFGKRNIFLEFIGKLDSKAEKLVSDLKFRALQVVQSTRYILLVKSKIFFKNLFDKAMEKIIHEYKIRQNSIIMGRKEIASRGSVSFYLKKITENKDNSGKGKIEDSF